MWYTLDADHEEQSYKQARRILDSQLPSERLFSQAANQFSDIVGNVTEKLSDLARDALIATGNLAVTTADVLQDTYTQWWPPAPRFLQ